MNWQRWTFVNLRRCQITLGWLLIPRQIWSSVQIWSFGSWSFGSVFHEIFPFHHSSSPGLWSQVFWGMIGLHSASHRFLQVQNVHSILYHNPKTNRPTNHLQQPLELLNQVPASTILNYLTQKHSAMIFNSICIAFMASNTHPDHLEPLLFL